MIRPATGRRLTVAASLLALTAAACAGPTPVDGGADGAAAPDGGFPVTVQSCGRDVTVDAPPQRVLLGYADVAPTLEALGVADSAFGYLTGDLYPAPPELADLQEVSPDFFASRESVIGAQPDLMLVTDENQVSGEQGTPSYDDLDTLGSDAYVLGGYCLGGLAPTSIDRVYDDIRDVGAIMGVPDAAAELQAQLRDRVGTAAALRGEREPVSVAFVQTFDGVLYALSGGYYAMILESAGLANEFADLTGNEFVEISAEEVLVREPEAIFVVTYPTDDDDAAVAAATEAFAASPAAQQGAVYPVPSGGIAGGGVGIIDRIEEAAQVVYGG